MHRTRLLAAALVAGTALVASGCGGDDSEESASTKWAGDLCTAIKTWQDGITSTVDTLKSNPSRDGFEQAADDAETATQTLVDTVKGLGTADTEAGEQARAALDTLTTSVQGDVDAIKSAVDDAEGVQGLVSAAASVSTSIAQITSALSSFVDQLGSLRDVDDQLRQSFADADTCDGLLPAGS